jgi:hypothetical protein
MATTTAICATVAPNITIIRRSICLSKKANAIIATITTHATMAAPHKEISDTNMLYPILANYPQNNAIIIQKDKKIVFNSKG